MHKKANELLNKNSIQKKEREDEMKEDMQILCRGIEPRMPLGIYSTSVPQTFPLSLLTAMTYAQKNLPDNWKFEVMSEDNCHGDLGAPLKTNGEIDHQSLQKKRPAKYVLISINMSCTLKSAQRTILEYQGLEEVYRPTIIIGGIHAGDDPKELLNCGKNIIVICGEGEMSIVQTLEGLEAGESLDNKPNLIYWGGDEIKRSPTNLLKVPQKMMDSLPIPNYSLVKYAKINFYFVEALQRGCGYHCTFCRVSGQCRFFSTERSLAGIEDIIKRGGRRIFIVCDHAGQNMKKLRALLEGIIELKRKYGVRLFIMIQARITIAEHLDILRLAKQADIKIICIGFESPIKEDLEAMKKSIDPTKMIEYAHIIQQYTGIHYMGMIGFPRSIEIDKPLYNAEGKLISARELVAIHLRFMKEVNPEGLQPFIFGPLLETEARRLLEKEGRIYWDIGFEYYTGFYVLSQPDEGIDPLELQEEVIRLAENFYSFSNLWYSFWEFRSRVNDPKRLALFIAFRWKGRKITRMFRRQYENDFSYKNILTAHSKALRAALF